MRRKENVDCYVGEKFTDPVVHEDSCECTDADYEWSVRWLSNHSILSTRDCSDYNYVQDGDHCVPVGPEPIPAGACKSPTSTYMGSSGYRKIPGNTCTGGSKDKQIVKPCSPGKLPLLSIIQILIKDLIQLNLRTEKSRIHRYVIVP